MAYNTTEQFRILFLDRKNILIADEVQQKGTVDHTPVYPREVVKRALDLGASGIIMVHNQYRESVDNLKQCIISMSYGNIWDAERQIGTA